MSFLFEFYAVSVIVISMIVCAENAMVAAGSVTNVPDNIYRIPREVVLSYNR